jgi:hypothetical protein
LGTEAKLGTDPALRGGTAMTLHLLRPELRPERRDKPDFRAHSLGGDGAVVIERVLDECISITWLSPT